MSTAFTGRIEVDIRDSETDPGTVPPAEGS